MVKQWPKKFNQRVIRERILLTLLMLSCIYFLWYVVWGLPLQKDILAAEKKREDLLSLSETIVSQYKNSESKDAVNNDIAFIDKRIDAIKSKMGVIDQDIHRFNEETILIGEIVLLLKDILSANDRLSLESLKVYPAEIIQRKNVNTQRLDDAFEKSIISMKLKGDYANVFDYLKKIESLRWSVFWQDVKYIVDAYPQAVVEIKLYTLSIIEEGHSVP